MMTMTVRQETIPVWNPLVPTSANTAPPPPNQVSHRDHLDPLVELGLQGLLTHQVLLVRFWILYSLVNLGFSGSGPVSLAESMQMVDEILANGNMDRMDRIERLESILSAATQHALVPTPTPIPPIPAPPAKPTMVDSETQV